MKKILSIAAALVVAAAFISCGDSGDSFDGKTDTVLTIGAPSVTAKAYPGVNYVTWTPVASAKSYEVYRIADGEGTGTKLSTTADCKLADVANSVSAAVTTANTLVDGVTYKYVVIALPENAVNNATNTAQIPSRAIYMKANQGSASVKAIIPAAGTAIDAKEFGSYAQNFIKKYYKDDATAGKNIKVVQTASALSASYPATAGFVFGVKFINHTQPEYINESKAPASTTGLYLENYTANFTETITNPGKYTPYLTMKSVSNYYPDTKVFAGTEYTIEKFVVDTHTANFKAAYNADGSKIIFTWEPAKIGTTKVPTTNYKLYKAQVSSLNEGVTLEPVTLAVETKEVSIADAANTAAQKNTSTSVLSDTPTGVSEVYYAEEAIAADKNNVDYTYVLVNTNGKEFEARAEYTVSGSADGKKGVRTVAKYSKTQTAKPTMTSAVVSKDNKQINATIKIKFAAKNNRQTLDLTYLKLDASNYKTDTDENGTVNKVFNIADIKEKPTTITDKDITDITPNSDVSEEWKYAYVENATVGTYLFKLTAKEDGFAENSAYQIVKVAPNGTNPNAATVGAIWSSVDKKAVFYDTDVDEDTVAFYTYNLVMIEETHALNSKTEYKDYITVKTTSNALALAKKTIPKTGDSGYNDNKFVKYGVPAAAYKATPSTTAEGYVIGLEDVSIEEPSEPSAGYTVERTYFVQKVNAKTATDYDYTKISFTVASGHSSSSADPDVAYSGIKSKN